MGRGGRKAGPELRFKRRSQAELSEKCEGMVAEGQGVSDKWAAKLSAQSEAHRKELRRHHDTWAASEKVRREKWMGEKTAQVKAQTIRGPSHPIISARILG